MDRVGLLLALLLALTLVVPVGALDTSTTLQTNVPAEVFAGERVTFEANLENASNEYFTWDFGDGSTASGWLVSNTYEQPGTYNVIVTAYDDGIRTTDTIRIVVRPEWQDTTTGSDTRIRP